MARMEKADIMLRTRSLKEAVSTPSLSKVAGNGAAAAVEAHHSRSGSERDSSFFEDLDVTLGIRSDDGVLETFHDAKDTFR